jgi:glycosyltransferase involved in cell wall biosynthesis
MPAYNRADLIGESIDSALAQTFRDFELIVVDDGSTDATRDVVRQFRDPRLALLELPHRGMSAAMNAGVRAGRGIYFARLDSDDLWHPEFLAATVAAMEQPPRVGVVYTRARTFGDHATFREADRGLPLMFPDKPFESMLVRDHASAAALVRVECHQRVGGFDETLRWWEDWDFWLRVSRHYAFRFVDRTLVRIRIHGANASRVDGRAAWATRTHVLDKAFAALAATNPELERLRALAYRNAHFDAGLHFWQCKDAPAAALEFRRGVRASGRPAQAAGRLLYVLLLHHLGQVSAVRESHRILSQARQRRRQRRTVRRTDR